MPTTRAGILVNLEGCHALGLRRFKHLSLDGEMMVILSARFVLKDLTVNLVNEEVDGCVKIVF